MRYSFFRLVLLLTLAGASANQPGLCTVREMRSLADSGIPLRAIFEAATVNNASRMGLSDVYCTVEQGKIANLLLPSSNPLEDIRSWDSIEFVLLHGKAILQQSLAVASPGLDRLS